MCYHASTAREEKLREYLGPEKFEIQHYQMYFNADGFGRPFLPISCTDNPRLIRPARWKLLPFVVKNEDEAWRYANTLNARSEDIFKQFSYRSYILKNRCLVWIDGFFEPNHPSAKVTVPYYVTMPNHEPFTLGGVYADWVDKDTGETYRTFSVITTPPNQLMAKVHNKGQRMPFIVPPEERDQWLGPLSREDITEMMRPLPDGTLQARQVSGLIYKRGLDTNVPEVQE